MKNSVEKKNEKKDVKILFKLFHLPIRAAGAAGLASGSVLAGIVFE